MFAPIVFKGVVEIDDPLFQEVGSEPISEPRLMLGPLSQPRIWMGERCPQTARSSTTSGKGYPKLIVHLVAVLTVQFQVARMGCGREEFCTAQEVDIARCGSRRAVISTAAGVCAFCFIIAVTECQFMTAVDGEIKARIDIGTFDFIRVGLPVSGIIPVFAL